MEKTVRLTGEQREDLVAYLDGELPDEEVQQIDQIIARSEVARHEVEALARTWELLDILPPGHASADFTTKTMTNLKVMEQPFVLAEHWVYRHLTRILAILGWIVGVTACSWLGFQITRHWIPNPNDELLQNMPFIEHLDEYQDVGDIEFLKLLKQSDLFDTQERK